jgi:hypothetical protein
VFRRENIDEQDQELNGELAQKIKRAYDRAGSVFNSLPGGVHALPLDVVLRLVKFIGVLPGDCSWDIGCGDNRLSSSLSAAASGGTVVCTDIGKLRVI